MLRAWMILALAAALALPGCGKISDEEKTDAANLMAGMAASLGNSVGDDARVVVREPELAEIRNVAQTLRETAQGVAWLAYFQSEAEARANPGLENALTVPGNVCTSFSFPNSSCTASGSVLTMALTFPGSSTQVCNGTTYTLSSASFSMAFDFANVTGTWGAATGGTLGLSFSIAANVSGGKLDGKKLECGFAFSFDIAAIKANTATTVTPSCDNFSCKYDGNEISCADIQNRIAATRASCG